MGERRCVLLRAGRTGVAGRPHHGCRDPALESLARFREQMLLVLQPVTPFGQVHEGVDGARLVAAASMARELGFDVRVLPQMHRALGLP